MDQVIKVTFPAFSRLQDKKQELSNILSKSIFFICLLVFPSLVMLILIVPSIVEIIPKYNKWNPALTALMLLGITSALAAITTPLTNFFSAVGKISLTFKLMIMWTTFTWVFVPALAVWFGVTGAALGFSLVGLSSVVAMILVLKYVKINYPEIVGKPLVVSLSLGGIVFAIRSMIDTSLLQVASMIAGGVITYIIAVLILEPKILSYFKMKNKN